MKDFIEASIEEIISENPYKLVLGVDGKEEEFCIYDLDVLPKGELIDIIKFLKELAIRVEKRCLQNEMIQTKKKLLKILKKLRQLEQQKHNNFNDN